MRGRKSVYDSAIKPNFDKIETLLENGATEKQIAKALGIAYSTFNKYKAEKPEFAEVLKSGRKNLVEDLRGALIKKAMGFKETETKIIRQKIFIDGDDEEKIPATLLREETMLKYYPPDVAAINLALKNYDRDNWSNDWHHDEIKREELEIKKKLAEQNVW